MNVYLKFGLVILHMMYNELASNRILLDPSGPDWIDPSGPDGTDSKQSLREPCANLDECDIRLKCRNFVENFWYPDSDSISLCAPDIGVLGSYCNHRLAQRGFDECNYGLYCNPNSDESMFSVCEPVEGAYLSECSTVASCKTGLECRGDVCVPDVGTLGSICDYDADDSCLEGLECDDLDLGEGTVAYTVCRKAPTYAISSNIQFTIAPITTSNTTSNTTTIASDSIRKIIANVFNVNVEQVDVISITVIENNDDEDVGRRRNLKTTNNEIDVDFKINYDTVEDSKQAEAEIIVIKNNPQALVDEIELTIGIEVGSIEVEDPVIIEEKIEFVPPNIVPDRIVTDGKLGSLCGSLVDEGDCDTRFECVANEINGKSFEVCTLPTGVFGAICTIDTDCQDELICIDEGGVTVCGSPPGGYLDYCSVDQDCVGDLVCDEVDGVNVCSTLGNGVETLWCSSDEDCAEDLVCRIGLSGYILCSNETTTTTTTTTATTTATTTTTTPSTAPTTQPLLNIVPLLVTIIVGFVIVLLFCFGAILLKLNSENLTIF